ncbi:MAG: DUF882 domain-containing protein [Desulfobacteraceae bacterium]|nr:DUF882 domain-containing protein [Desulfobacteraceae bacterium]
MLWCPQYTFSANIRANTHKKTLDFFNIHTRERISACYYNHGEYQAEALTHINHVLRDHRSGEVHPIDKGLLDVLFDLKTDNGIDKPFHVISGYRSETTNTMLANTTSGVAKKSLHTKGRAIDIRVPGIKTKNLRNACIELQAGGVGYYPKSDFVHMDTGSVRCW